MKRWKKLLPALAMTACLADGGAALAQGLPLERYVADPEHKDEIIGFYLNALLSGMSQANARSRPPLFCLNDGGAAAAYEMLDRRIARLQQEKKLSPDMTVDTIVMDMLIDEFPCR